MPEEFSWDDMLDEDFGNVPIDENNIEEDVADDVDFDDEMDAEAEKLREARIEADAKIVAKETH